MLRGFGGPHHLVLASSPMTTATPALPLSKVRAVALGRSAPVLATVPLGTVDAAAIADIDEAAWIQMRGADWSLDWWVGAEDRWHLPADEPAVRQQTLGASPVMETAMRVPGGDIIHRAFAVRASSPSEDGSVWEDSAVVVELENTSSVPVAMALVLRPLSLSGDGSLRLVDVEGPVARVDGRVALVLSRPVVRVAHGPLGEVQTMLAEGRDADPPMSVPVRDHDVALVVPLAHSASVRVMLPRVTVPARRRRFGGAVAERSAGATFSAPDHQAVVSGWATHTRDAASVTLGDPALDEVVSGAVRSLAVGGADHVLEKAARSVAVAELLARSSSFEPLGPLARALVDHQRMNGMVRMQDGADATAALIFSAAALLRERPDRWEEALLGPVAKAVHAVHKRTALVDPSTWASGLSALSLLSAPLRSIAQPGVADSAEKAAKKLRSMIGQDPPRLTSSRDYGSGGSPELLQQIELLREGLARCETSATGALLKIARLGGPLTMSDSYDSLDCPAGSLGYDPGALAARASAVIDMALRDEGRSVVFLPGWVDSLWGRHIEVRNVATGIGLISYALRWHGKRPAILWEIVPWPGGGGEAPLLSAPGLDPSWRQTAGSGEARGKEGGGEDRLTAWSGEALLAEVEPPENDDDPGHSSDRPVAVTKVTLTPTRVDLSAVLPQATDGEVGGSTGSGRDSADPNG